MYARILIALAMAAAAWPAGAPELTRYEPAPNNDVTFEVPINLTQLAADITKVDVSCSLTSNAIVPGPGNQRRLGGHVEFAVSNGQVVAPAATVVVAVPAERLRDPEKQTFNWECGLTAYSVGARPPPPARRYPAGWDTFADKHDKPSFVLSPTPPAKLSGSFVW